MTCEHQEAHIRQLAASAPQPDQDDLQWRAHALSTWIGTAQFDGVEAERLEPGHPARDDHRTHCGTVEMIGRYWDVCIVPTGEITTTRTRWDVQVDEAGDLQYLPYGPETVILRAPYVVAVPQNHDPLPEHVRFAVATAAEPRLMTAAEGYLVERCVRAALSAVDAQTTD